MKKLNFTFSVLWMSVFGNAQVFTADHCFHPGTEGTIAWTFLVSSYADALTDTGFDHTWNYAAQGWAAPTGQYIFQTGAESGNANFTDSGVNESGEATFARDLYYTYSENNDTLYYDGLANVTYTPSVPYLTFPLNQGDSLYHHQVLYALIGGENTAVGSATRTWKYDGYGTVILPYGTQQNVFRIKTTQVDSTYITNFAVIYEEMMWFRASDGLPVLRFQQQGGMISAYYAGVDNIVAVEEDKTEAIRIYPNPATDVLNISGAEGGTVVVYDMTGREVMREQRYISPLNISALQGGTYFLRIAGSPGVMHWVKE